MANTSGLKMQGHTIIVQQDSVELKLVALDSLRYTAQVFRPRHSLEVCVNSASVFACVVLNSQETSKARRASDPQVYK